MREIKFRVWDNDKNQMFLNCFELIKEGIKVWHKFQNESSSNLIWQQYTGLKDKKGREIYEGDIVEYFINHHGKPSGLPGKAFIKYNSDYARWQIAYKNIFNKEVWDDIDGKFFEVIGNIYQNPKLFTNNEEVN